MQQHREMKINESMINRGLTQTPIKFIDSPQSPLQADDNDHEQSVEHDNNNDDIRATQGKSV